MAITAEKLRVDVEADTSQAKREVAGFSKSMKAPVAAFGAARAAALAFGGTAVAAFAGKAIMAASDLNEQISKTQVVFGSSANDVIDNANKMADAFGLPKAQLIEAAGGIGLVAKASGLGEKGAAKMSNSLANLASDAASFYNVPLADALTAMKSGLVGEAEPMRAFGVLLSENAVKAEAYRLGLAKQGAELTEGQKVQARSSLIMKGMSDASGDLARTQTSVANRLREIKGRAINAAASLGTALLPAVSAALGGAIKLSSGLADLGHKGFDWVKGKIQEFSPQINAAKTYIVGLAQQALPILQQGFQTARDTLGQFIARVREFVSSTAFQDALSNIKAALIPAVASVKAFIATLVANKPVLAAIGIAIGLMVAPIPLLIAGFIAAYTKIEWFRTAVNAVVVFILGTVIPAFIRFGTMVRNAITAMIPAVSAGLATIMAAIRSFVAFVVPVVRDLWTIVSAAFRLGMAVLVPIVKIALIAIQTAWKVASNLIVPIVKGLWQVVSGLFRGAANVIGGIVHVLASLLKGDWSGMADGIKQIARGLWQAVSGIFRGAATILTGVVRGMVKSIGDVFRGAVGILKTAGQAIIRGLIEGITSMSGAVSDAIHGVLSKARDLLPFSPAKKGPFSGKGWTLYSGHAIVQALADGVNEKGPALYAAMLGVTEKAYGAMKASTRKHLAEATSEAQAGLTRLTDMLNAKRDAFASLQGATTASGISGLGKRQSTDADGNVTEVAATGATIAEDMAKKVADATTFAQNLATLAARKLNATALAQLAQDGADVGGAAAAALVAAGNDTLTVINDRQRDLMLVGAKIGKIGSNAMYLAGQQAAQGLATGFASQREAIEAQMLVVARGMKHAIKKALGIASPSKVMAVLGRFAGKGLEVGLGASVRPVAAMAGRLAGAAVPNLLGGSGTLPDGQRARAAAATSLGGSGATFIFHSYNPVAEAQSITTNKGLQRAANLGLVG